MNCEIVRTLMSLYIDNEINNIDREDFEKHLKECEKCRNEYNLLRDIVSDCSSLEEIDLPEGFHEELHERLATERTYMKPSKFIKFSRSNWKVLTGAAAALLIVAVLAGSNLMNIKMMTNSKNDITGSSQSVPEIAAPNQNAVLPDVQTERQGEESIAKAKMAPQPAAASTYENSGFASDTAVGVAKGTAGTESLDVELASKAGRKIIKSGSISIEVQNLNETFKQISEMVNKSGGHVENSQSENVSYTVENNAQMNRKQGYMIVRVPQNSFQNIFESIKSMGILLNESISGSDITMQYRDTTARVNNLKVQEKRLQELLLQAKNVDEILRIESELNRVRTDIDIMSGDLRRWDDLVELSTININVIERKTGEIKHINADNVWKQAYNALIDTINKLMIMAQKMFVFLVASIPYIIFLAILIFSSFKFIKKKKQNK